MLKWDLAGPWFKMEGVSIVYTMIINSVLPIVIEIIYVTKRKLIILWDKGFKLTSDKTKCTSI